MMRPGGIKVRVKKEAGIALLIVMLSIALLSSIVARYGYEAHIDYQLAVNTADEAQAYYLAKSGISIYKLILTADQQITGNPQLKALATQFGINLDAFAIWRMVPELDTRLLRMMTGGGGEVPEEDQEALQEEFGGGAMDFMSGSESFLDFEGDIRVTIEDEASKLNINDFLTVALPNSIFDTPTGRALYALTLDEKYDSIFEGYNALGENKLPREEVIANIYDWMDSNTEPVQYGGGIEDALYYRYDDEYRARNAKFETMRELAMVRGIDDDFVEAFFGNLTIYAAAGKININTAPVEVITGLLMAYALEPITSDNAREVAELVVEYRGITPFSKPEDFVTFCQNDLQLTLIGAEGTLDPTANQGVPQQKIQDILGTESKVFTIKSTGYSGQARVTITAVVDNTGTSFRYIYWRVN